MLIKNRIADCRAYLQPHTVKIRPVDAIRFVVLHRVDPVEAAHNLNAGRRGTINVNDVTNDIVGVAMVDSKMPQVGSLAYPFLVHADGLIEQGREISHRTPHAKSMNRGSVAIAMLGNFNVLPPTADQWESAMWLTSKLQTWLGIANMAVLGHDEIGMSGTEDPNKKCPGVWWSMDSFRRELAEQYHNRHEMTQRHAALLELQGAGVVV